MVQSTDNCTDQAIHEQAGRVDLKKAYLVMHRKFDMSRTPMCAPDISNPNIKAMISKDETQRLIYGIHKPSIPTLSSSKMSYMKESKKIY